MDPAPPGGICKGENMHRSRPLAGGAPSPCGRPAGTGRRMGWDWTLLTGAVCDCIMEILLI